MSRRPTPGGNLAALAATLALLGACGERPRPGAGPEEIYRVYCARCHGDDGRGAPQQRAQNPRLDLLTGEHVAAGDRAGVRAQIANGHGPMPGFQEKLSPEDLDRLTDFVLRWRPASAP